MSQSTYSFSPYKRARVFSQISNDTNRSSNYMLTAPTAITRAGPKRGVGGSGVQKAGTKGANRRKQRIPYNWITERMFPKLYTRILNYGQNFNGLLLTGDGSTSGDLKMLRGEPGKQFWCEFYGLPLYWPKKSNAANTLTIGGSINSTYSLYQLMSKTSYANPFGTTTYGQKAVSDSADGPATVGNFAGPGGYTPDVIEDVFFNNNSGGGNTVADVKMNLSFIYDGGYQKHTFINHSNYQQWIEIFEAIPKVPMFDWFENAADGLEFETVGRLILADYKDSTFVNVNGSYDNTSYQDEVTDRIVKLNSKCKRTLQRFKCSKPIVVCLAPGEQFVYKMDYPSFKFDEASFMEHIRTVYINVGTGFYDVLNRPTSVPRFTKRLVVRCWGEYAHSDVSTANVSTFTGSLQPAQVNLFHLQEEVHNTRWCPLINKTMKSVLDVRTVDANYGLQVFNDQEESNEAMDS